MIIDFNSIEEVNIPNFKGGEKSTAAKMFFDGDVHYCPKGHTHSLVNDSAADLEFSAVVPMQ